MKCFESTIISGKLKGKKILIPNINTTRSSKAILRESLFNTLQFELIDKIFVEVFAGSGSVGLEALSRGAKEAVFIEKNNKVFEILKENIRILEVTEATAIQGDSFEEFSKIYEYIKNSGIKTYFYFDPPFSTREGMDDVYEKTINLIEMIEAGVCEMVIMEHMTSIEMPQIIGTLALQKKKKFGKSSLSYYVPI
ncbi:MAG: 16S rRNA (guanine(966)-N(2))-methyltransferase RsmD [Sulfurovum sp.]|nr:16S rRNA (guanine(966)-N(2))-methyltransferase RsmD [Sulfurovum sp.]